VRLCALLFASALAGGAALAQAPAAQGDVGALLAGVREIAAPGIPGPLCLFRPSAFAVVLGKTGNGIYEPVVAGARLGRGRVVAFGHTGYFAPSALNTADTGRLMLNAVRWARGAGDGARPVAVRGHGGLLSFLREHGVGAQALGGPRWMAQLGRFSALCLDPTSLRGEQEIAAVRRFVENGGGLVVMGLGWGWLQLNPGKALPSDHPGNLLLAPAGIAWADGMFQRTSRVGFAAGQTPPPLAHAGQALDALEAHAAGKKQLSKTELAQAVAVVSRAARTLPLDEEQFQPRLARLCARFAEQAVPRPDAPLGQDKPLARLALTVELQRLRRLPPEEITAHPAAKFFPGPVPDDAPRVTAKVEIDTARRGWHSTGLYAPPGELVVLRAPERAVGKGLWLRIGAHSDSLWQKPSWRRCPEVCWRAPIASGQTRLANPFGGLVYVEVPARCKLGRVTVTISGCVNAPHFVLGKTKLSEWRASIRQRPAPWAELQTSKVVLTVPSRVVRELDDPEELLRFWDRVMDSAAELAAIPKERELAQRYVCDVQISAGYMHSGYPIMTWLDVAPVIVDLATLKRQAHGGVWGLFHELGHNHQSPDWTFDGTVEVTCNLFTLYILDNVCGIPPREARACLSENGREKLLRRYFARGAKFSDWKRDPFLALIMYVQLQEAFGWEAYKNVFAEYRQLAPSERPRSDAEKRDQWLVRFSRAVGRNLGPFFQAWGVPTSEEARKSLADLPVWMPEGFPPK